MDIQAAADRDDKLIKKDITVAEIRAAGYGASADVNENKQSDYIDAMDQIRSTEQYQEQTDLQREKENNRMSIEASKFEIEKEKIQSQREIADRQLQIAQENKNKYDLKTNNRNNK